MYGRAYPEASAYPAGVPVQADLAAAVQAARRAAVRRRRQGAGEYYYAADLRHRPHRVVVGKDMYYEIQFGHRVAFVRAADVNLTRSRA